MKTKFFHSIAFLIGWLALFSSSVRVQSQTEIVNAGQTEIVNAGPAVVAQSPSERIYGKEWLAAKLAELPTWGSGQPGGWIKQGDYETIYLREPLVVPKRVGIYRVSPAIKSEVGSFVATPELVKFIRENPERHCIEFERDEGANEFNQGLKNISLRCEGALNGILITGVEGSLYKNIEIRGCTGVGVTADRVIRADIEQLHVWGQGAQIGLKATASNFTLRNCQMHRCQIGYSYSWCYGVTEVACWAENTKLPWMVANTAGFAQIHCDFRNSAEIFLAVTDSQVDRCTWTHNKTDANTGILVDGKRIVLAPEKVGGGRKRFLKWAGNIWPEPAESAAAELAAVRAELAELRAKHAELSGKLEQAAEALTE